ncbi:MAG: thermonuclease family protein [Flavobacteriales bacterium]|nr:thermonuclease family protein [Flavobacteriales bacterium]
MMRIDGIYSVLKVVDGDGMIIRHKFSGDVIEIRLYGIDAPEVKRCKKLRTDEKITRLAGQYLIKLGHQSRRFLAALAPIGSTIHIRQEKVSKIDFYGRHLAYAFLPDGRCINELMITSGYAKPLTEYPCNELGKYRTLNAEAKRVGNGLYNLVPNF